MDIFGWGLLVWAIGSLVFLFAIETGTSMLDRPTISARVQSLGDKASIVVIWASFMVGYLLSHFFD